MKQPKKIAVAVLLAVGFLVNSVLAEVRIINHGGTFLPHATLSDSWIGASNNWMTLLRTGVNSVGSGMTLVTREHHLGDYKKMTTSSSVGIWKGAPFSIQFGIERGNFWYQGIQIKASAGETFIPSEVTFLWETLDSGVVSESQLVSLGVLNSLTQVLNPDNSVPNPIVTNAALPTNNLLFGGVGRALTVLDGSDIQSRIDATSDYWWARDYKIRYTITVPYKDSLGVSQPPMVNMFEVSRIKPRVVIVGTSIVLTDTAVGKNYALQYSVTLANDWDTMDNRSGSVDPIYFDMSQLINFLDGSDLNYPKTFYRVAY